MTTNQFALSRRTAFIEFHTIQDELLARRQRSELLAMPDDLAIQQSADPLAVKQSAELSHDTAAIAGTASQGRRALSQSRAEETTPPGVSLALTLLLAYDPLLSQDICAAGQLNMQPL